VITAKHAIYGIRMRFFSAIFDFWPPEKKKNYYFEFWLDPIDEIETKTFSLTLHRKYIFYI